MSEPMAYIGRCPECNRIIFTSVDSPENKKELAKDVGHCIKDGLLVERVTCEEVRKGHWGHEPLCKRKKA